MSIKGLKYYLSNPTRIYGFFATRGMLDWLSDRAYLKMAYRIVMGEKLNIDNPTTFNEKLQWLKVYDHKPEYTTMVDKYEVKKYVADRIGEEYIIPVLGVWDNFDDIDFDSLPEQFVLKCTHDSGGLIICKDKSKLDIKAAKAKINKSLKRNYYRNSREWPYKNVKPRILAEQYMVDKNSFESLNVYKIMTFNGTPKIVQAIKNDKTEYETIDYFDTSWNLLDLKQNFPNSETPLRRPQQLDEMLRLAEKMCAGFAFLRVDFYEVNGKVYFSEFTFYSDTGMAHFTPSEWNRRLGDWIKLPPKNV